MSWTPIVNHRRQQQDVPTAPTDVVKVLRDGSLVVSADLLERMGAGDRVALLTNADPSTLGIRAFRDAATEQAFKLDRYSTARSGRRINSGTVLWHLNRQAPGVTELPHAWDDDVLVVDLSALPTRMEG